ncbi:polysaccharide deacetylase family protein [Candidatus Saccharibacteria bacterium]|nr:polysaccharide deacetylase family protein [Candidatus Saccharibacteria bacterium]
MPRRTGFFREYPWMKIYLLICIMFLLVGLPLSLMRSADVNKIVYSLNIPSGELGNSMQDTQFKDVLLGKIEVKISDINEVPVDLTDKKLIVLTFDDGPSEYTNKLLDILKAKNVKATFFTLGSRAAAFPEVIKRASKERHEIESHTTNHRNLTTISASEVANEVQATEDTICGILARPGCIKYVRPPYGAVNDIVRNVVKQPLMGWSIDSLDWKTRDSNQIRTEVRSHAFDGAVILMHDIYDTTVGAVEGIIDDLRADGYTIVTIDEMVRERDPNLTTGVLYGDFKP